MRINIENMLINKSQSYFLTICFSFILIFMDAYELFGIPIPWMGMVLLVLPAFFEIKKSNLTIIKILIGVIIAISIPQIFKFVTEAYTSEEYTYLVLRYFNIFSFALVLIFSSKFFYENSNESFLIFLKYFILMYSLLTIYIYFAQIFDLFEFERTRENTNMFGESSQSTFWLSQPHRAMSTFREPVFLITFLFALILIYFYFADKNKFLLPFLSGIALGLTRSDYVRLFSIILIIFLALNFIKTKKISTSYLVIIFSVLIFSTFGFLECNINPSSIDCQKYEEDLQKINDSGEIQIKTNATNPVTDLDADRVEVLLYFFQSLENIQPQGLINVNLDFQNYSAIEVSEEMYFTNRTLPKYLLTRYSTQNFGTGNYSVLRFVPNVQNMIIFYTYAFGLVFPAIFFLTSIHLLVAQKFKIEAIFFLMIVLFFAISPIEEVNSFYGLLLGFLYQALFKGNNEKI